MITQSAADKIKSISAKFNAAESIVTEDIKILDSAVEIIKENKSEYNTDDVMNLELMREDFDYSRETLKETISYGRKVLEMATQDLLLSDSDKKANNTIAFAELTTAVLNGVKTYSALYKDFSNTLLSMHKISGEQDKIQNVNNTVNIIEDISTVDLIERLKEARENN